MASLRSRAISAVRCLVPGFAVEGVRRLVTALDPNVILSYSQEGEDLILRRLFENQATGFYVDVGAHHPSRFSNTFTFYRRGWSGINIEPNPDVHALFQRERPRDINLCLGIAGHVDAIPYFMFNEPALNTFDSALAADRQRIASYRLIERRDVRVRPLSAVLSESLGQRAIDFMSVDVENFDLQVLQSNDWTRFRPSCLIVEARCADLLDIHSDPVHAFAASNRYMLIAKTVSSLIYRDAIQ